jgi:diamine N-acetyltransferase
MPYIIRPARSSDAHALSSLARETFVDTYAVHNTEEDMRLHLEHTYTGAQQLTEIENPGWLTLVAESGEALAGFAQGRFSAAPPCIGSLTPSPLRPWEILRFYVHRNWHGRGLAQALMQTVSAGALAAGADAIWLGVWTRNERACAFYVKCGFNPIGETTFTLGKDVQRDLVMCKALPAS